MIQSLREASEAIKQGEVVCIFAEGQITRIGQMLPFRRGMERIMKGISTESTAPIVPVHLDGVWGSIFSDPSSVGAYTWLPITRPLLKAGGDVPLVHLDSPVAISMASSHRFEPNPIRRISCT